MLKSIKNYFSKKNYSGFVERNLDNSYKFSTSFSEVVAFSTSAYYECSPVGIAIDLISDIIANLPITAQTTSNQYNNQAEILNKLQRINKDQNYKDFVILFISNYLLYGNVFVDFNKVGSSFEMVILKPQNITINTSGFGKPSQVLYIANSQDNIQLTRTYNYKAEKNIYETNEGNLLLHFRDKNLTNESFFGSAPIISAQLEISQYINASIHNNSLLRNQCRPSYGFFFEDDSYSSEQLQGLKTAISKINGPEGAGKSFMVTAGRVKVERFSENPKDMDFQGLKVSTANAIYNTLKIPLALFNDQAMSYNNYSESQIALYASCILPLANKMIDFFNYKILPLLGEQKHRLVIEENRIAVLEMNKIQIAKAYGETYNVSTNEARARMGLEAVDNGDTILKPANLVAMGTDIYTTDNRTNEKAFFVEMALDRGVSENEAKKLADRFFDESKKN